MFVETPFSEPLRGAEAIRRWWLDVPYSQSEITFSSGEIYAAGPWFSTEFKCVFRRKRTGEWVDARGAIFCETEGGPDQRDAHVLAPLERGTGDQQAVGDDRAEAHSLSRRRLPASMTR